MVSLVDVTLNVASGVMMAVLIATSVRSDWVRFVSIVYAVFFLAMFVIPDGGQVNAALPIGMLAFSVLNMFGSEGRVNSVVQQREKVKIFEGIMTAKSNIGKTYNTYDTTSPSYKRLPQSINRMGGAQFSYSFWIMFERGGQTDESVAGKTIFMRGDKQQYQPRKSTAADPDTPDANYFENGMDYTIACPRVSFVATNQLAVDINTDTELRTRFLVGSSETDDAMRKNALSLIPGHFALMTLVFEDGVGIDSFENGVRMKFYLNNRLYQTSTTPGSLRQNKGPLHLFLDAEPSGKEGLDNCKVADLTYYNYALEDNEVDVLYSRGFTNEEYKDKDSVYAKDVRLHMDLRNSMDYGANFDDRLHKYPSS